MQINIPRYLEARLSTIKVLIVDDDHYMRKVVRAMLTALGIKHIHEAHEGAKGIQQIKELMPDLVIVDWEMPAMDGIEFIRTVRSPETFPLPDVPIILLTGHADRWRVVEAARYGVNGYLLKPVSTKALLDRIAMLLAPRRTVQRDGSHAPQPHNPAALPDERPAPESDVLLLK